ncbi:MAG: lipid A deacylase LpxR family protein [Cyclobacteriaceae bacterium]
MKKSFLLLFLAFPTLSQAQDSTMLRREIQVTVDNDALFFGKNDKYYSSGVFIKYRRLIREEKALFRLFNKKGKLSKAIVSYDFVHRMYTASDIDERKVEKVDRPYAGWFSANLGLAYHFKKNSVLNFDIDLGWLGPDTRTDDIQIWWHDILNMKDPNGWGYQINNTPAANISLLYLKRLLKASKGVDFITEQFAQFGTIRNNIRSGMTIRMGNIGNLDNSIYTNSKMGQMKKRAKDIAVPQRTQEIYFYFNATFERVFYNTTIEGNFIGEPSAFTKVAEPWVFHHTWGFARSGRLFDWRIAAVFRSTEVKDAKRHKYIAITLAQRF